MGLIDKMRDGIRSFLKIETPNPNRIIIRPQLDFVANTAKNRIWYRGDSKELSELYNQIDAPPTIFWKAHSTKGMEIRKIHTGLPSLIVRTLANIIVGDFNGIGISDAPSLELWQRIYGNNGNDELLKKCIEDSLIVGDGAFKISFDSDIDKELPIIEFYPGEKVEFQRNRGRINEVVFITQYVHKSQEYTLKEHYGKGYITYNLYSENGSEVNLNTLPQTTGLTSVAFAENIMLAVPCVFGHSPKYNGRGESIFDSKIDNFDALDEAWSQWLDALRSGRSKQYIPESLIPRDINTGVAISPNAFDNRFIAIGNDMSERALNKVQVEQPNIPHESYLSTYITALDLCLQGIISPSTLGIDVKKMDNAEAQREKEKTTLYTRANLVQLVEKVMPELVKVALCGYHIWHKESYEIPEISVKFGEYANPSFEAVVETVSKAKQGGIMSIETCVDELYGDSKDQEWKDKEIARIKAEQGIVDMNEPTLTDELDDIANTEEKTASMLNGAQIASLMNVIKMVKEKSVTRSEGISIITSTLGISRENAESFIENNESMMI